MKTVYIKPRAVGRVGATIVHQYVVEDEDDRVLATFSAPIEAIGWAQENGHQPLLARSEKLCDKTVPDHWQKA
jgi:hypothetical protein